MKYKRGFGVKYIRMKLIKAVRSLMGVILTYSKRKKQRNEKTSPFAIRYRAFRNHVNEMRSNDINFSVWFLEKSSILICDENITKGKVCTVSFSLLNNYNKKLPPLEVSINLYTIGSMRLRVNETNQFVKFERYKLQYNDVIKDRILDNHFLIKNKNLLNISKKDNSTSICFYISNINTYNNDLFNSTESKYIFKLKIIHNPFKIETYINDKIIHSVNYNGNFNFERARPFVPTSQGSIKREDSMKMNNVSKAINYNYNDTFDLMEKKIGIIDYITEINSVLEERKYQKRGWKIFGERNKRTNENDNKSININNSTNSSKYKTIDAYDIYTKNSWFDIYDRFPDYKVYGPTSVGTDIRIHNSIGIYGGSEHCSKMGLQRYKSSYRFYNLDVFAYDNDKPDALYGSVPFLVNLHSREKYVSGVLWLNPSDTFMDIKREFDNKENSGIDAFRNNNIDVWWVSETGIIDLFLCVSDNIENLYYNYHIITGFPLLTPKFGLGKHQSRWNYFTRSQVLEISKKYEQNNIPLDSIWLDIEHLDKRKCFTWNENKFNNVSEMLNELDAKGRNLVVIADPHIHVNNEYHVYKLLNNDELIGSNIDKKSNWVKIRSQHKWEHFVGICWPGKVKYPDFLNSKVRDIYSLLYTEKYYPIMNYSNIGFWIDMNEPSVFSSSELTLPKYSFHNNIEHRQVHNIYSYYHLKSTFTGLLTSATQRIIMLNEISNTNEIVSSVKSNNNTNSDNIKMNSNDELSERIKTDKLILDMISKGNRLVFEDDIMSLNNVIKNIQRPFILTRSFFVGSHCYCYTWTGDNKSDYDSFTNVIPMNLTNSICGVSYTGSDVGGFYGHPCVCLLLNWHKLSIWMPFYRVHCHIDSPNREPWEFEDVIMDVIRKQVNIRYELLSFWYTISLNYSLYGIPILKPFSWLLFEYMSVDSNILKSSIFDICENNSFLVGNTLLIYNTTQNKCICNNRINAEVNNKTSITVILPNNNFNEITTWYDYYSSTFYTLNSSNYVFECILDEKEPLPCYVKESSIIPYQKGGVLSSIQQLQLPLRLKLYLKLHKVDLSDTNKVSKVSLAKGTVFLDDGVSYNYLSGEFVYNEFNIIIKENKNNKLILPKPESLSSYGSFSASYSGFQSKSSSSFGSDSISDLDSGSGSYLYSGSDSILKSETSSLTDFKQKNGRILSKSKLLYLEQTDNITPNLSNGNSMTNLLLKSPQATPSSIYSSISSSSFYSTSSSSNSLVTNSTPTAIQKISTTVACSKIVYQILSKHKTLRIYDNRRNNFVDVSSNIDVLRNKWVYRNDLYLEYICIYGLAHKPLAVLLKNTYINDYYIVKILDFSVKKMTRYGKEEIDNEENTYEIEINTNKMINLLSNDWKILIYA
ncbi:alpha glucosidase-like family 31 glycosyl hydrolase [Cryptosporidium ryanae]|uniref:alpha glucosidase-like family 31 glycosyl hydrolase n=1 Tax=Cryptosporidium ryanae TaxID=515981 RepID=UPI00351A0E96|nr:alpha glucosidase-like family 31 glycosyl hydrolase [Cryptosporidium ryanae]